MGEEARPDFRGVDCAAADWMGFALAGCAEISQSGCAGEDAFSGVFGGGGEIIGLAQGKRKRLRHTECGLWGFGGFRGAPSGAGGGLVSTGESFGFKRGAGSGSVPGGGAD